MDTVTLTNGETVEAGCWLDGHMGWHNNARVVQIAKHHGFEIPDDYLDAYEAYAGADREPYDHNEAMTGQGELVDQATDFLEGLLPDEEDGEDHWSFVWDMGELSLLRVDKDVEPVL